MTLQKRTFLVAALAAPFALPWAAQAQQGYPTKPVRMIVPFPPGGGTDILSRLVASRLGESARWTIVVDNRAGAGGTIGLAEAAKAAPTGYDMVMGQKDNMVVAPWLYKHLSYDPTRDLVAVASVAYTPVIIATSVNSRFKTLADVVNAARGAPNAVTYGSPGNGTTIHLAGDLFSKAAKVELRHVPYRGSGPALLDVLAGNVDLLMSSVPSAISQIKAGKLRPLAVTSAQRSSSFPDVPTVAELGYKGFDVSTWYGIFMPARTPREVIDVMNRKVNELLATPDMKAAIQAQGAEPLPVTPQQFSTVFNDDYRKWESIVKDSGATIE